MWDVNHLLDLWDALLGGIDDLAHEAVRIPRALIEEVGGTNLLGFVTVGGFVSALLYFVG